ncbi:MAG: hypothetical protein M1812_005391 [Candelaria pacifica]|nr:MAG: hypothetical protein M1812_005391 [Candelaria pacifica]
MRGRRNVIPGTMMFSIFGLIGQSIFNILDAKQLETQKTALDTNTHEKSFWQRVADSKWSPMKVLTDGEYEVMLREKLLRVDAEIAIIDQNISSLKESTCNVKESDPKRPM